MKFRKLNSSVKECENGHQIKREYDQMVGEEESEITKLYDFLYVHVHVTGSVYRNGIKACRGILA